MKHLTKVLLSLVLLVTIVFGINTRVKAPVVYATVNNLTWTQELEKLLQEDPGLKGSIAGVSIRSADTGELIFSHNGDIRMTPASNLKLFTSAAALSALGEEHKFSTELLIDGKVRWKTLHGNVYVKGKGDPTLLKEDLNQFARQLVEAGINKIDGNIIGDDSWFDDVRYSVDMVWSDEATYYGGQVSGLTLSPDKDYDSGTVIVTVKPGKNEGDQAVVSLTPETKYVKVINQTKTVNDAKEALSFDRKHGTNTIVLKGDIPLKVKQKREWISLWEPTKYVLDVFKESLEEHGVKVTGSVKVGKTPDTAKVIGVKNSIPLSELLVPFMKLSNNGHGETLVKEMGKVKLGEGSWKKGLEVMDLELIKLGIQTDSFVLRDGSGISSANLIPANEISNLLYLVQDETWFPAYLNSLPVAGIKDRMVGGTLRYRMNTGLLKDNVKAKTGSLTTVSSLSGYLTSKSGKALIFSIVLNHLLEDTNGKAIEDRMVEVIANQ